MAYEYEYKKVTLTAYVKVKRLPETKPDLWWVALLQSQAYIYPLDGDDDSSEQTIEVVCDDVAFKEAQAISREEYRSRADEHDAAFPVFCPGCGGRLEMPRDEDGEAHAEPHEHVH